MKQFFSKLSAILSAHERSRMLLLALADMLTSLVDVLFLAALVLLINSYTHTGTGVVGNRVAKLLAGYDPLLITGIFLLLYAMKNIAAVGLMRIQHKFVSGVASRLSQRNLLQYLHGSYLDYVHTDSSVRVRQISQMPIEFGQYVLTNLQTIIAQGILIFFTVCAMLLYHPALFMVLFLVLMPPVVLLGRYIKCRLSKVRTQIKASGVKSIQYLQEALAGYIESNVFGKTDFFVDRFQQSQQALNQGIAVQQTLQGLSSRLIELFALAGFCVLVVLNRVTHGSGIDLLSIGIFMAAAYKIIPGIVKILNSAGQIKTYSFTLDGLLPVTHSSAQKNGVNIAPIKSVAFKDISFRYNGKPVLSKFSFTARQGCMVGISGVSGRGKTTLINLLLGFLPEDEGEIHINNQPVDVLARKGYWQRVAYVKQQGFFINDTIRANITLNNTDTDEKRLTDALRISGLDRLLLADADGLDKQLRENGKNISGGQRQRLMLARALYHDFDLLILDEPFSEMDEAAEHAILEQLQQLLHNKLLFFITHNHKSLTFCNQTILLDAD
ncbi:ABC-type bacteriocin/lantibiotic exporter with double-glycine peptidase domain [Mucilaginibacter yixingensis]|uniref:ABC-type bacteriocin/lantibiotic exporter with double-glycine peptidase domain n=1 Tax=Mucilaginibacter yixingensis TaxID=1295612 RepID=A0A2T5J7J0_9SPHI|nr:ABC transporter ATP-binding protein [Mucilaginibacter yixingensis]PTQ95118.1 ABC-type bacteriocin/lantibiotic exporter with double-glycine peptidase domain [Mucilaginibacter yixingensis]